MSAISYRKDIDGLRAVAVLLVIFSHAKISWLAGGFIGVDIFFVISGFLITSIIRRELEQGTFSFIGFYMRRVRRILPALVFLLIGTAVLSTITLVPSDLILFAKSSVASITAWSNVFFSNISGGYWGKDVSIMPLAHLWSLAVEEQFYFIWPAVFFCLYVFVPAKHLRRILIGFFVLLFVGSVVIAKHPKAYYMLTARAFELMLGVLLAIEKENVTQIVHRVPSIVASGFGAALILLSALVLKEGVSFPGWNALWPCLGAGLLIVPPKGSNILVRCLESAPMVYIGKISYSLYLWHWPFFALLLYYGRSLDEWRWEAIALSFLMAVFSYYMIEQPLRKSKTSSGLLVKKLFVIPVGCCFTFLLLVQVTDGMSFRYSLASQKAFKIAETPTGTLFPNCCSDGIKDTSDLSQLTNSMCFWGGEEGDVLNSNEVDILLVGDSHAEAMRGFLEELSEDVGLQGLVITKSATPYIPGIDFVEGGGGALKNRRKHNSVVSDYIMRSSAKYIVLTGRYSAYLYGGNEDSYHRSIALPSHSGKKISIKEQEKIFAEYFEKSIARLVRAGKVPIIIKDVPEMGTDLSKKAVFDVINNVHSAAIPLDIVTQRQKVVDSVIDSVAVKYPTVKVLDPKALICRDGNCFAALDDMPLYADDDHLNYYGSRYLAKKYLSKNINPFSID